MARPPSNAPPSGLRGLTKLPRPPKSMPAAHAEYYRRFGTLLLDAGTLAATDVPMIEAAARVRADLDELRANPNASAATIAALERLHKEQLIQLGLTPQARRNVGRVTAPSDDDAQRIRELLG